MKNFFKGLFFLALWIAFMFLIIVLLVEYFQPSYNDGKRYTLPDTMFEKTLLKLNNGDAHREMVEYFEGFKITFNKYTQRCSLYYGEEIFGLKRDCDTTLTADQIIQDILNGKRNEIKRSCETVIHKESKK